MNAAVIRIAEHVEINLLGRASRGIKTHRNVYQAKTNRTFPKRPHISPWLRLESAASGENDPRRAKTLKRRAGRAIPSPHRLGGVIRAFPLSPGNGQKR